MAHISNEIYYGLIHQFQDHVPMAPDDISVEYAADSNEWYHLLGNELDFPVLIALPSLKWYSVCRCHLKDEDGNSSHEHFHALVHFTDGVKLRSLKRQWIRKNFKLHAKTTFKPIICMDHLVGVLRYICCKDGQRIGRRGADGLATHPHEHYSRRVSELNWLHKRGTQCAKVRSVISEMCASSIEWKDLGYHSTQELHKFETCKCDRGREGMERKAAANQKRRQFYETARGKAIKKGYKEKAATKKKLISLVKSMKGSKKADLMLKSILSLAEML